MLLKLFGTGATLKPNLIMPFDARLAPIDRIASKILIEVFGDNFATCFSDFVAAASGAIWFRLRSSSYPSDIQDDNQ